MGSTEGLPQPMVVKVTGPSDSGKTTLIELLTPALRELGLRVGSVKHAHKGFELDRPGKDSWRHIQAGTAVTALIGPRSAAWLTTTSTELTCEEAIGRMADCVDIVLVEGFKQSAGRRIALEPGGAERLHVEDAHCRLGAPPNELSADELATIAWFCLGPRAGTPASGGRGRDDQAW